MELFTPTSHPVFRTFPYRTTLHHLKDLFDKQSQKKKLLSLFYTHLRQSFLFKEKQWWYIIASQDAPENEVNTPNLKEFYFVIFSKAERGFTMVLILNFQERFHMLRSDKQNKWYNSSEILSMVSVNFFTFLILQ